MNVEETFKVKSKTGFCKEEISSIVDFLFKSRQVYRNKCNNALLNPELTLSLNDIKKKTNFLSYRAPLICSLILEDIAFNKH